MLATPTCNRGSGGSIDLACSVAGCLATSLSNIILPIQRLAVTAFAKALLVCFKDGLNGTRDYRALAGLISLVSIVFGVIREFILKRFGIGSNTGNIINFVTTCCIITYIQPCKSAIANISLSLNLLLLTGLHAVEHYWHHEWSIPTCITFLFLIYFLFLCFHFVRKERKVCCAQIVAWPLAVRACV